MKKGIEKGIVETAGKMLSLHYSLADIREVTGLSEEAIKNLKDQ